jgi:hypothetical protein
MDKYGPFINIIIIASALVATFSTLLLKMLGNMKQWTWLVDESPSFLVTAGPRMIAVSSMAMTYVTINHSNYMWFIFVAILIGCFGFWSIIRFDRLQKLHIVSIPLIGKDGKQLVDKKGRPLCKNVVIGLESELLQEASDALNEARKRGSLSLREFMAGYGRTKLNDPEALWDREILVDISNKLSVMLMYIVLSAVMVLFLSAFVIEISH